MFAIHDLAAFVAVADGGSVRRAAEVLGRTQPAITQAIQRLEDAVGFELLDRSNYRAQITERGALFLRRARATVLQAKDLKSYAHALSQGAEAKLRISIHGALAPESWMTLFSFIPTAFPDTVIELQTGEGHSPLRRLLNDEADLAIAINSPIDDFTLQLHRQMLGEIEFVNVVSAACIEQKGEQYLDILPQILVSDFDDADTMFGVAPGHRFWRVSDHRCKVAAIAQGIGWGAVPHWMASAYLTSGEFRSIQYRGIGPVSRHAFYLYHRQQIPLGPVAATIWKNCADKMANAS